MAVGRQAVGRAREMLLEALAIAEALGVKDAGQSVLDASAGLAMSLGEWVRAARLHGSSEAQMERMGTRRTPADEAFVAPLIARARTQLGEASFAGAQAAGRGLDYGDAITEVRHWLEAGMPKPVREVAPGR